MSHIYISRDGVQQGPYTLPELRERVRNMLLSIDDPAWYEGLEEWITVKEVPGITVSEPVTPPHPSSPTPSIPIAQKLPAEEAQVWKGRPSWLNYSSKVLWVLFLALIALLFAPIATPILAVLAFALPFIARASVTYRITNRKAIVEEGIFIKSSTQIRIGDIRSLNLSKKGMAGFLFGLGTIELSSAASDKTEIVFRGVRGADRVMKLIENLQEHRDLRG